VTREEREGPDIDRVREVLREVREDDDSEPDEVPEDERLEPPDERQRE
jgi:hypothetical protein